MAAQRPLGQRTRRALCTMYTIFSATPVAVSCRILQDCHFSSIKAHDDAQVHLIALSPANCGALIHTRRRSGRARRSISGRAQYWYAGYDKTTR
ncbi:hypothetical protein C8Q77DRAFT_188026 [Trametes polyzona]|nr:hypothetical protein C8Q77DRAFT_188026 [Trametes polyzona]